MKAGYYAGFFFILDKTKIYVEETSESIAIFIFQ